MDDSYHYHDRLSRDPYFRRAEFGFISIYLRFVLMRNKQKFIFLSIVFIIIFIQGCSGKTASLSSGENDPVKDRCQEYCSCLQKTCSEYTEHPFQDEESCLSACASYTMEELQCWHHFCSTNSAKEEHLCEHAWGKFGLDECPQQ